MDHTTHLVYQDLVLARQGEKYTTAVTWGIPVLPFSWLTESAKQGHLLPFTQLSHLDQPEAASPATKMQQLCLGEDTLHQAATAQTMVRHSSPAPAPPDVSSQPHGKHMICSGLEQKTPAELETAELISCFGSYDPEQQAFGAAECPDRQEDASSETCSNRSSPSHAVEHANSPHADHAEQANAHSASSQDELTIPDSQPDDAYPLYECQLLAQPAMTAVPEGNENISDTQPSSSQQMMTAVPGGVKGTDDRRPDTQLDYAGLVSSTTAIIPDSPTDITNSPTELQSEPGAAQYMGNLTYDASPSAVSVQGDAQHTMGSHSCDASPHYNPIPDTELQALPSTLPQQALEDETLAASTTSSSSGESRAKDSSLAAVRISSSSAEGLALPEPIHHRGTQAKPVHPQIQPQQGSTHQFLPQSIDLGSTDTPSTSYASRAFVLEDSDPDSVSDFQPLRPARLSTSSSHLSAQPVSKSHRAERLSSSHKAESLSTSGSAHCGTQQPNSADRAESLSMSRSAQQTSCFSESQSASSSHTAESLSESGSAQVTADLSTCKPEREGCQGVVPVKWMSRHPRGTTVKEHHGLSNLKGIQFAEQLQASI